MWASGPTRAAATRRWSLFRPASPPKGILFGTAGFGGDPAYFSQLLDAVRTHLPAGAEVIGSYMCQGKMLAAVRARYESMPDSPKKQEMLDNFDRALSHPNDQDLDALRRAVLSTLS